MVRNGVAVYVVDYSLFPGFVGNQLAEPGGSGRNRGAWIFSRHGGSGRFEPADILCGHSSGGGGQHHESLHSFTLANEVPAYREQGIFRGCRGGAGL